MKAFISHVSEEALEARALKMCLETAIPGAEFFVSTEDIHLGDAWLEVIKDALVDAGLILVLCSPNSVRRPWINFESGTGWSRQLPVVPVCYKGMRRDQLPDPLGIFQAVELTDTGSCRRLVEHVASVLSRPIAENFGADRLLGVAKTETPSRTHEIGIVLCSGQGQWEARGPSVFTLPRSLPTDRQASWSFRVLDDERLFLSQHLREVSGIIMASPWRARMKPETVDAIVEWVMTGGRLLLLGFELGDRHHGANLSELSHRFGIEPACDIVGPPGFGDRKPYDVPIDFIPSEAEKHPLTREMRCIRLSNVQTVRVDPGGIEWLRVGSNVVYRPLRDSVRYRDGTLTMPGGSGFEINSSAGWMPVAVEAPQGLCGRGSVHMIGSWDILGRNEPFNGDNLSLVERLLDWLAGRTL